MWYEKTFLSRKIWAQEMPEAPIFILGQARSGTTLLFKLMCSNPSWIYFDGTDLYFPYWPPVLRRMVAVPLQAIFDLFGVKKPHFHNYNLRLSDPVEEDMQFCFSLSPYTSYWGIAWSKRADELMNGLIDFPTDLDKEKWKSAYLYGLKRLVYYHHGKRLVLKNPPSMGRVAAILELFPDAKFVHISRNPVDVFRSLEQLANKVLFARFSMQHVEEPVIRKLLVMHYRLLFEQYQKDKKLIPAGNLCEVTYDEVMEDPIGTLRRIHTVLGLDGWEQFEPHVRKAVEKEIKYVPNQTPVTEELAIFVRENFTESCMGWERQISTHSGT